MPRNTRSIKWSSRGSVRADPTDMREVLRDRRTWTAIGIVFVPPGEDKHWELVTDDQGNTELMVNVALQPDGEPLFCRLASCAGNVTGGGVWAIPAPGLEVGLVIPYGELEADPYIVCTLSHTPPSGLSETTLVIAAPPGGTVLIHDGTTGGEERLVRKSDFDGHKHDGVSSGSSLSGVPSSAPFVPAPAGGTTVLRAK